MVPQGDVGLFLKTRETVLVFREDSECRGDAVAEGACQGPAGLDIGPLLDEILHDFWVPHITHVCHIDRSRVATVLNQELGQIKPPHPQRVMDRALVAFRFKDRTGLQEDFDETVESPVDSNIQRALGMTAIGSWQWWVHRLPSRDPRLNVKELSHLA